MSSTKSSKPSNGNQKETLKLRIASKNEPWPEITVRKYERITPRAAVQCILALLFSLLVLAYATFALYRNDGPMISKMFDLTFMIGAGLMGWALGRAPSRPKNE